MSYPASDQKTETTQQLQTLVVTCSDHTRKIAEQALTLVASNLKTQFVDCFDDAQNSLTSSHFDLCICIEPLDNLSALELLQQTRSLGSESPFIAVLQKCGLAADSAAMWAGAADVLEVESLSVGALAKAARHAIIRHHAQQQLRTEARVDFLTGALNRRYFLELVSQECNRSKRFKHHASLMILDIDRLKLVNDRFGHQAGDKLLETVAHLCQKEIREIDSFARYGGDEFALLLPETSGLDSNVVAHRIQSRLNNTQLLFEGSMITPGLCIGLANTVDYDDPAKLIDAADQAMLKAKRAGRGRVEVAPPRPKTRPNLLKLAASY